MKDIPENLYNIEMEQQLLGALLSNNDLFPKVSSTTKPEHFCEPTHGRIFQHIADRISRDQLASPVTLKEEMALDEGLKDLGGVGYLARLVGSSISSFAVADYAAGVESYWRRRSILDTLDSAREAVVGETDPDAALSVIEGALMALPEREGRETSLSFLKSAYDTLQEINEVYQGRPPGVSTGLRDLDRRLSGFSKQDLILLAGRPSMGKTALALHFALTAASGGSKVAIVSREMSHRQLTQRLLSDRSRVEYAKMRTGSFDEAEFRRIMGAAKEMESLPIRIIPDHVRDVAGVFAALKTAKKAMGGLDLVIIDYLQLLEAKGYNENNEVSKISAGLKNIAKSMDVPVVALSQLSRGPEARENKRPVLSDLRASGSLEQDADVVLFCYRHEYYMARETPPKAGEAMIDWEAEYSACRNKMEVITAKQRMGPIGVDIIGCHMPTNRFWDDGVDPDQMEAEF